MTGFTPEPWTLKKSSSEVYNADHGMLKYGVSSGYIMICAVYGDLDDKDAALIAAAPDLHRIATEQAAEIARLREALKFYAPIEIAGVKYAGGDDAGWRATAALAEAKP
jgi:hypothetical protein